jgi:hypothetical protein
LVAASVVGHAAPFATAARRTTRPQVAIARVVRATRRCGLLALVMPIQVDINLFATVSSGMRINQWLLRRAEVSNPNESMLL